MPSSKRIPSLDVRIRFGRQMTPLVPIRGLACTATSPAAARSTALANSLERFTNSVAITLLNPACATQRAARIGRKSERRSAVGMTAGRRSASPRAQWQAGHCGLCRRERPSRGIESLVTRTRQSGGVELTHRSVPMFCRVLALSGIFAIAVSTPLAGQTATARPRSQTSHVESRSAHSGRASRA